MLRIVSSLYRSLRGVNVAFELFPSARDAMKSLAGQIDIEATIPEQECFSSWRGRHMIATTTAPDGFICFAKKERNYVGFRLTVDEGR